MVAIAFMTFAKSRFWLLTLNGLTLSALGLLFNAAPHSRISLRMIAALVMAAALTSGIFELIEARSLYRQHHIPRGWAVALGGVLSLGCALAFVIIGFGGFRPEPGTNPELIWFATYFGLTAVSLLVLTGPVFSHTPSQPALSRP
jgi:hypothetical protein